MFKKDEKKATRSALAAQRWVIMLEMVVVWLWNNVDAVTKFMIDTVLPALVQLFGPESTIGSTLAGVLSLTQSLNPTLVPIPLYLYA